jgi:hypothetical protein
MIVGLAFDFYSLAVEIEERKENQSSTGHNDKRREIASRVKRPHD